jgi:hypothetical protein
MTDNRQQSEQAQAEDQYLETIALLQEDVARLEEELLAQQALQAQAAQEPDPTRDEAAELAEAGNLEQERLRRELAARDETIALLLDQLGLVEEAERATRAEWEQLAGWLAEVEDRVERRERGPAGGEAEEVAALRRQLDESRASHARDREAWDRGHRELARENQRLTAMAEQAAVVARAQPTEAAGPDARWKALEAQNEGLRERCRELEADCRRQVETLDESLRRARLELEEASRRAAAVEDARARERREFEVALASIRAQSIRTTLHAAHDPPAEPPHLPAETSGPLEADLRIRVFRQHLREIHDSEEESRNRNRLGARLARLWTRTGPAPARSSTEGRS